jgi:hypothetical protein
MGPAERVNSSSGCAGSRASLAQRLTRRAVTEDEWQAHVNHQAAKAIVKWLEGRGGLQRPIRCLTIPELEAMAQNAISVFIAETSQRLAERPNEPESQKLSMLLMG